MQDDINEHRAAAAGMKMTPERRIKAAVITIVAMRERYPALFDSAFSSAKTAAAGISSESTAAVFR